MTESRDNMCLNFKYNRKIFLLATIVLLGCFGAYSQSNVVKILGFSVNGVPVDDYSMFFLIGNKTIKAHRLGADFEIPNRIKNIRKVGIRFKTGDVNLDFGPMDRFYPIQADLILGVYTPPFDMNTIPTDARGPFTLIYFMKTVPRDTGDNTRLVDGVTITVLKR